jgi:hypothetical protein
MQFLFDAVKRDPLNNGSEESERERERETDKMRERQIK